MTCGIAPDSSKAAYMVQHAFRVSPPSRSIWNHRVSGKSRNNLWGSITCGQNLDVKELKGWVPSIDPKTGRNASQRTVIDLNDDGGFGF
jgi:hypothetical protein